MDHQQQQQGTCPSLLIDDLLMTHLATNLSIPAGFLQYINTFFPPFKRATAESKVDLPPVDDQQQISVGVSVEATFISVAALPHRPTDDSSLDVAGHSGVMNDLSRNLEPFVVIRLCPYCPAWYNGILIVPLLLSPMASQERAPLDPVLGLEATPDGKINGKPIPAVGRPIHLPKTEPFKKVTKLLIKSLKFRQEASDAMEKASRQEEEMASSRNGTIGQDQKVFRPSAQELWLAENHRLDWAHCVIGVGSLVLMMA